MRQIWHDLLFAHWEVSAEQVRRLVPSNLDLDLFAGKAYVAVAPFRMSGIRARALPPLPGLSRFPELNVSTYVRYHDVPGVYFFSLDAANLPAVWSARSAYGLPYFHAKMTCDSSGEAVEYHTLRQPAPDLQASASAEFRGRYWPISQPKQRGRDSLEYFLTERYCLYAVRRNKLFRAYIHHLPWPLQDADAQIEVNTMATAAGIELPARKPLLHFSRFLEVLIWWPSEI